MPLLFVMVPKETRAPPLIRPTRCRAPARTRTETTGAGSVRTMETPLSPASVTVKLLCCPWGSTRSGRRSQCYP